MILYYNFLENAYVCKKNSNFASLMRKKLFADDVCIAFL